MVRDLADLYTREMAAELFFDAVRRRSITAGAPCRDLEHSDGDWILKKSTYMMMVHPGIPSTSVHDQSSCAVRLRTVKNQGARMASVGVKVLSL